MRTFACQSCGQLVFFENTRCLHCEAELGFWWPDRELLTLKPHDDHLHAIGERGGASGELHRCENRAIAACNWLTADAETLCASCELTVTRPADTDDVGIREFAVAEAAKRRLLFELGELGLPVEGGSGREGGLSFDFLSSESAPVTTGHANGLITLDLAESDDARRVARRQQLAEPYRTVLGHLRHEIGHYYWPLVADRLGDEELGRARELFGDERDDYDAALERHYADGPPPDWEDRYVSAYATMHPAEDWAETFAHYLHIRDGLQTASAYRVRVLGPENAPPTRLVNELSSRPLAGDDDFEHLLGDWLPLTYALNALTRSIGRGDLYPFVLSPRVIEKLAFVHGAVHELASAPDASLA